MKIIKEGSIFVRPDGTLLIKDFHVDMEGGENLNNLERLAEDRVLLAARKIREARDTETDNLH